MEAGARASGCCPCSSCRAHKAHSIAPQSFRGVRSIVDIDQPLRAGLGLEVEIAVEPNGKMLSRPDSGSEIEGAGVSNVEIGFIADCAVSLVEQPPLALGGLGRPRDKDRLFQRMTLSGIHPMRGPGSKIMPNQCPHGVILFIRESVEITGVLSAHSRIESRVFESFAEYLSSRRLAPRDEEDYRSEE